MKKENRTSDYVCESCGKEYLSKGQLRRDRIFTSHTGECGLCGKTTGITHIRNYNYLNKVK